jgi:hypothetical protein
MNVSGKVLRHLRFSALALYCLCLSLTALAADDAESLRGVDLALTQQLGHNQFQRPIVLVSVESPTMLKGDVYAELNYPFATVSGALNDPVRGAANWCDVLILHINTKYCHASTGKGTTLSLNIGQKTEQELSDTDRMQFNYKVASSQTDYFRVALDAGSGPLNTRDYDITLEAVALKGDRTFLHLSYAYSYGVMGRMAMKTYLATLGSRKVGFTIVDSRPPAQTKYIGGVRGMVERNAMRYYLAIDAYLGALSSPAESQRERRLMTWFSATEKYPRQLHEIERGDYMMMKRREQDRQLTVQ